MEILRLRSASLYRWTTYTPYGTAAIWSVSYKGYIFHIDAAGEVRAYLYLKKGGKKLCYVKDKTNGGYFRPEMTPYFRSDKTLYKLIEGEHCLYDLSFHNTNWWECFVTDPQGKFHDIM